MEKRVIIALFLLVALSAAPFIVATSVSGHQSAIAASRSPDDSHERNLSIQVHSGNETEIDSEYVDHISIHFFTEDGISLRLEYNSETNTTATEFQLEVKFISLVELVGNNIVSTIDLTKVNYSSAQVTNITSSSGATGYRIESHAIGTTYTFQIIAYIYTSFAIVNSTNLNPTEMKIAIVIENFPYTQPSSALGLVVDTRSQAEIHSVRSASGEDDIEVSTTVTRGYFSWSNSALVDNVARSVGSSVSSQGQGPYQITLIYPHGTKIVHDPVLGISSITASILPVSTIMIVGIAAIIALAVVLAVRRTHPRIQNSHK